MFLSQSCSKYDATGRIKRAIDSEAIAPWVTIWVGNEEDGISVGNESAKSHNNKACISSFQYGISDGSGCTIEIIDEEGGVFQQFIDKLTLNLSSTSQHYFVKAKWGWVMSNCTNRSQVKKESQVHCFNLIKVSVHFDQCMKYTLHCVDTFQVGIDTAKQFHVFGDDGDNKMKLKDAIRQLFAKSYAKAKVEFRKVDSDNPDAWDFKDHVKGKWATMGQGALASARRWIQPFTTENDKGVVMTVKDTVDGNSNKLDPTIIFWEYGGPDCNGVISNARNIGTYIVNGGEFSPVIEFSPQIKFIWSGISNNGGTIDTATAEIIKQEEKDECDYGDRVSDGEAAGPLVQNSTSENAVNTYGDKAAEKTKQHDKRHNRANIIYNPIDAELRIQGDPELDDPIRLTFATCSIIVVNPFSLSRTNNGLEWYHSGSRGGVNLAGSTCNEVLSNSSWQVMGASHEIRLGSYTTTLKVKLLLPGSNINKGKPLGSSPNGYQIPNQ